MPIDPIVALAFSISSNKGVYALLLGSGISQAAGIPTGWEVVQDLIHKLATASGEHKPERPEEWFKARYGVEPGYSTLLDELTRTATERTQLLRPYFEPTDEEREQDLKTPTKAHRAIAQLMHLGYFRVVLTTNFDRLLEHALHDLGVEPVVISTPDALKGAPPLTHAQNWIVKLHGDYLDTRLRNTPEELDLYDPQMDALLDRILDEFGLIVCGWSGEHDTALRSAINRSPNRRYPFYWTARRRLTEEQAQLVIRRAGVVATIDNADDFLTSLHDSVVALERIGAGDPISTQVAVARTKKYIADPESRIAFHDLLFNLTEELIKNTEAEFFSLQSSDVSPEALEHRLKAYDGVTRTLLSVVATASYWADQQHSSVLVQCLHRLLELRADAWGFTVLDHLSQYPGLLYFYTASIAAIAGNKYDLLRELFNERVKTSPFEPAAPLASWLNHGKVMSLQEQRRLPGLEGRFTPLSDRSLGILRPLFVDNIPSDSNFERMFDLFEYLLGAFYFYQKVDWSTGGDGVGDSSRNPPPHGGPFGAFAWRHRHSDDWILNEMEVVEGRPPRALAPVREAFFSRYNNRNFDGFLRAMKAYNDYVRRVVSNWP